MAVSINYFRFFLLILHQIFMIFMFIVECIYIYIYMWPWPHPHGPLISANFCHIVVNRCVSTLIEGLIIRDDHYKSTVEMFIQPFDLYLIFILHLLPCMWSLYQDLVITSFLSNNKFMVMVFNATFNNHSVISGWSV